MRFTWNCHVVMRLASRPDRLCFRKRDPRLTENYNYTCLLYTSDAADE